jgi:transposase
MEREFACSWRMTYIQGDSRTQIALFPQALDELVAADSAVRVVEGFVESLDLAGLGFEKAQPAATGRPPYHPGDLLKLYVYGYLNQVRSSRRLEREAGRNVELLWLLKRLAPDHKTIANFRKDNAAAIVQVCRAFTMFCREQELFGRELLAIDGSKFQAAASRRQHYTAERIGKLQGKIDARIAEYLAGLEKSDRQEAFEAESEGRVGQALAALKGQRERLQGLAQTLAASDSKQVVAGEPEAKLMRTAQGSQVGYNVQTAVDAKHGLIAEFELTSAGNDQQQLLPMARAAQQALQADTLTVVADTGYQNGEQAQRCEELGITPVVAAQRISNPRGGGFTKDQFVYQASRDAYRCPAGAWLNRSRSDHKRQTHYYTTLACGGCALRAQCTRSPQRLIARHFFAAATERADQRAKLQPQLLRLRQTLAERPFAALKQRMGTARFLVRGRLKAKAEMALSVLAYNLSRVINILGAPVLIQRLAI